MTGKWLVSFGTVSLALATAGAAQTPAGRLLEITVHAPGLAGNKLGDPADQHVVVYLPPSYESAATRRYPVVYLLHGYTGRPEEWTHNGYQGMNLDRVMDSLIQRGAAEMIVVVPNGRNRYEGSFYTNSGTTGRWEDFIASDVVRHVDSAYRTVSDASGRGIAGHSMGGFGAVIMGIRHPDVFGAAYALSPCCLGWVGDLTTSNKAWVKTLRVRTPAELPGEPQTFDDFFVKAFVALAAAFSPAPGKAPLYVDFPYRLSEGKLVPNPAVTARWQQQFPLNAVDRAATSLKRLRGLVLDYGENEEFTHIRIATARFAAALAERGVPVTLEVYPRGTHGDHIRERFEQRVIPFFSRMFSGAMSAGSP